MLCLRYGSNIIIFIWAHLAQSINIQPHIRHMQTPLKPKDLFLSLLHFDFTKEQCIEEEANKKYSLVLRKEDVKKEIKELLKTKTEFLQLAQRKNQLKQTLTELLNYRQSIDYDHKYKTLKFDHYQFPYRSNHNIKQQLNNLRLENREKRQKINQLTQQVKRKQRQIQRSKSQRQNFSVSELASRPTKKDIIQREDKFWVNKIDSMKSRYLNNSQQYKRAKIRHDYNLLVERNGCKCMGMKVCPLCSDLNLQTKRNIYTYQALLSPRYKRLYQ